jgi:hypothetical protein
MIILGFNCLTGWFSVWLYSGSTFYGYLIIICFYLIALYRMYVDSRPYRCMGDRDGEEFYLEAGIRHILSNARERYANQQNNNNNGINNNNSN